MVLTQAPAEAYLTVRSPEITAEVCWMEEDGSHRVLGETGLWPGPVAVPPGSGTVCLRTPLTQPLCRDLVFPVGQETVWNVFLADFVPLPAARCRVTLPARARSITLIVDGHPPVDVQVHVAADPALETAHGIWLEIPLRVGVWIRMLDDRKQNCLCSVPPLEPGEEYTCAWVCR